MSLNQTEARQPRIKMNSETKAKSRVLIVDDDPKVRELLAELLDAEGYDIACAGDGGGALSKVAAFGPDVLVSDVVMPVMNGIELCRVLKSDPQTSHIPVLLISGLRNAFDDSIEGLTAGADDYLNVPFRNEELLVKVARLAERHRAHAALRESEDRYRRLVELSPEAIVVHSEGKILYVNPAAQRLWGADSAEQLVGSSVLSRVHPDYAEVVQQRIRQVREEGRPSPLNEQRHVKLNGEVIDVEVTGMPFVMDGKPAIQAVLRDVTDRNRAQKALQENEQLYRELFENANDIIYTHDLFGNFTSLNRSGELITGYKREEAMRMNVADVIAPEYLKLARQMIGHKTDSRGSTVYELEIITKDRQRVRLEVSTRVIYRDGQPIGVQGIGRDLTDRKRSEEVLAQQSQREAMTHRISQAIRCSLDSSEIFYSAVHELGAYLKADRCSLFIKDDTAGRVLNVAEYHSEQVQPARSDFEFEEVSFLMRALDQNGALCFDDAANDPRIAEFYNRILAPADVRSIMYVAIRVGDEVTAAFALSTTREQRHWSNMDIALAKAVADQTGIAIRQAELYQKAEATSKRESLINRITMTIRASLSLPEVMTTATRELGIALDASRVHMRLYDPANPITAGTYEYIAPHSTNLSDFQVSYEGPVAQHLLTMSAPLVIDDSQKFSGEPEALREAVRLNAQGGIRSEIDYPIIVKERFRGALCIHQTDRVRTWTDDELALVHAVAERLAIGIAQAELFEMVAKAKSEWETTFDSMSDGIFIFDPSGHLKRVNRAGAAMENSDPRGLLGRECCDILRTAAAKQTCVVEKAIEQGRSLVIEVVPDRLNRPILVSIEPVKDRTGAVTAAVCTARDLSELRKVEAVAREHQSLLTNILESARESIYAVDVDGRFKWCNSATLSGLGYTREEFIGKPFIEMVYEEDRQRAGEKLQAALKGQSQTYEMRYFAADGRLRYARVDNSPLVVDGKATGVLGIARDITEQKEERERAARADKLRALGQLASGVAHDFNNSLAAILGRAQLLRRQIQDEAVVRNLEIIQTAAEDAAATVRRIQTFARKSPAKEFERLEVAGLLNDAIEITRTRWQNEARVRGLDFEVTLNAEPGHFTFGSASELREVFVNLIVNAVDAMPNGGKLTISCVADKRRLRLRFADNGSGMQEDVRQKIFDPFFTTKGAHGTGLGLSVSYSIIERHEGSISVASTPGQGTVFTIELPAVEIVNQSTGDKSETVEMPRLSILVIDDEPSVRETLAEMLEIMGHRVVLADSGAAGLQLLGANECELVFTDLAMPEMDGWETSREIRKRWPQMNVVLVTGYGTGTLPPDGEEKLVDGIIGKPFDFSQINQTITSIVTSQTVA